VGAKKLNLFADSHKRIKFLSLNQFTVNNEELGNFFLFFANELNFKREADGTIIIIIVAVVSNTFAKNKILV
jgi:hypothetical protein